jgi:Cytidylate kinase
MNTIITISRQYGSGGRTIGEKLAESLGIPFYDKELLARAAKDSGFAQEIFESQDEKPTKSFLYSLVMDTHSFGYSSSSFSEMPITHKVFLAQFDTIKRIADEGPCVIVGRCSDYALADYENAIHLYMHAPMEAKIKRIKRLYEYTESKAKDVINKTDKKRASYYNYYSNKKWGEASGYNLSIDSNVLGIEGTVEMIKSYIELKEKNDHKGI